MISHRQYEEMFGIEESTINKLKHASTIRTVSLRPLLNKASMVEIL